MLFPAVALERAMTIREVILRAMSGALSWMQAAEIIGCSDRTVRRWRARYEAKGYAGLLDRRRGRPSPRHAPFTEVQRILNEGRARARTLLSEHYAQLTALADALMDREQLCRAEFEALLKPEAES